MAVFIWLEKSIQWFAYKMPFSYVAQNYCLFTFRLAKSRCSVVSVPCRGFSRLFQDPCRFFGLSFRLFGLSFRLFSCAMFVFFIPFVFKSLVVLLELVACGNDRNMDSCRLSIFAFTRRIRDAEDVFEGIYLLIGIGGFRSTRRRF